MSRVDSLRIREAEEAARAVLSPGAHDFYAAGADEELTLGEAERSWRTWRFLPRVLRDVSHVDTSLDLLGTRLSAPVLAAPTAFHTMAHPDGEVATAGGLARAGSLLVLSSRATRPVEEVAAVAGPWWYQVYVLRDRELTVRQVERAVAAGARALVLTVDAPYVAHKPRVRLPLPLPAGDPLARAVGVDTRTRDWEQDPSIGPDAIGRLTGLSGLPVLVKGVLRADDAKMCVDAGAAGVIVSNHGGRQLDRAVSTASALPHVARAVGDTVPVLVDGGIRTGTDILTALALGARAVLVGRPVLWALADGGSDAVRELFTAYRGRLSEAMALAGVASLRDIAPDLLAGSPAY
ncbi:alpha-hydroxy acid oxidase [Streptomyces alboniger]|uniref:Alpha-hydroxy-acid oxidizing protein n=1 Tax=Streptomyces alboniger TaxID=132473 RepID=A0A5J6HHG3_STRAD|nr:alpha-hydroxy acid oxidase [Streptomyces alboniger]QEV16637.1 alpha-hydroxy-acid oxidizing protein [Streptomyces alboniger]